MSFTVPADALRNLYQALLSPAPDRPLSSPSIIASIAKSGWALSWQVEDLIAVTDRRLEGHSHEIDLDVIGEAIGIRKQNICHRPRSITRSTVLLDAWSAVDFASLLISLEMLGFAVDPSPLVKRLLPTIPKKGYISNAALDVLWHERCHGKNSITLKADDAGRLAEIKDHKLTNGYKIEVWLDVDGNPATITVRGPKHRRIKEPVAINCDCGQTWYRGDPESSLAHRKEHKRRMVYLKPQPHLKVLEAREKGNFDEHVDMHSALWLSEEMYSRAVAFKREEGYSFTQWSTGENDPNVHGFLFTDDDSRIVGACAFRHRTYANATPRWGLQWIWISRSHRRQGVLRSRWTTFRERFGDFDVESPVSDAMKAFLDAVGDSRLIANAEPATFGWQSVIATAMSPKTTGET